MVQHEQPVLLAVLAAVGAGCLIGWIYAQVFNRFGVPSFVVTLAGLLAFLGVQLWLLRGQDAINLPYDSSPVKFAQTWFVPAWLAYAFRASGSGRVPRPGAGCGRGTRRQASLSASVDPVACCCALLLLAGLLFVVYYLNRTRGVAWMFVFFVALVLAHELRC